MRTLALGSHIPELYSWLCPVLSPLAQSCLTLCDPMHYCLPGSSVHGILQARILEWVAMPYCRGTSQPRNQTRVSCIAGIFFTSWATWEAHSSLQFSPVILSRFLSLFEHQVGHNTPRLWRQRNETAHKRANKIQGKVLPDDSIQSCNSFTSPSVLNPLYLALLFLFFI